VNPTAQKLAELSSLFPLREIDQPRFDELVSDIYQLKDPAVIRPILELADDGCTLSGLIRSMLQSLEVFPAEVYVPALLEALTSFANKSPRWCADELHRLLWSPRKVAVLKESVPKLSSDQISALRTVLNKIKDPPLPRSEILQLIR
jgi:hypothetical protein